MNLPELLRHHGFSPEAANAFTGIDALFPPQTAAIEQGALDGKNILLSVPTASGKTLIAELAMMKALTSVQGRCLYVVPLKALANEKYHEFKKRFSPLGFRVGIATGDSAMPNELWRGYHLLVATAEKVDSLLRNRCEWLINSLKVVVLDEIHFLGDGCRGPTLEIIVTRVKQLNPGAQILALSATVSNADEIAKWLNAKLVSSLWRPIPLKEGVYCNNLIQFKDHPLLKISGDAADELGKVSLDTIKAGGQLLVFVNSRRSAQAACRQLTAQIGPTLSDQERTRLAELSKEIIGGHSAATKMCRQLADAVTAGAAFHHAGLKPRQRELIEENFKNNLIKVICSTPTLAAGVNLPARRAVIRDHKRFEDGLASSFIPVSEYKQCAGRAGRPQYDPYGEAVLMAKTPAEAKALYERYILGPSEPVISQLDQEAALRIHVLSSIAGGYVHDVTGTFEFLSNTFLVHQRRVPNLIDLVGRIFDFLNKEELIEKNGFRFFATPFGQCTSRLYLDPASAIILRAGLRKMEDGKSFSSVGILHLACCCPDATLIRPSQQHLADIELFSQNCQDELILTSSEVPALNDMFFHLSVTRTIMMLSRWIEEDREEILCDTFGIGPGDVYRHSDASRWLVHSAAVLAELFRFQKLTSVLENLVRRMEYGIREELIALTRLKGVGRVRARQLFDHGYKNLTALKLASPDDLAKVEKIGPVVAGEIIEQLKALTESVRGPA